MNTVKSFVKQFVATVKGDDVTVKAEKAFRQASSALKSQISALEGDTINLEDKVTDNKEAQSLARINSGIPIADRENYVSRLLGAKNKVTEAEETLGTHLAKIDFLKSELAALELEVEA